MIKLQKSTLKESLGVKSKEDLKEPLKIVHKIYKEVDKSLSKFNTRNIYWNGLPGINERRDGSYSVGEVGKEIRIGGVTFKFEIEPYISNKSVWDSEISFCANGLSSNVEEFTINDAKELLELTTIIEKLKEYAKNELSSIVGTQASNVKIKEED